ncbi:hypothetical protein KIPB_007019 [Kipferlia bialata]|uniref:Uncharacterized protein n=1 Tax=Kipferlia bialata TaxID=797122 RepID=A0A9K3D152_9EUKA|nr:hypothetical protein KIPB_007019 [Kipferlia bialata]|eukprot:g7019.t1
MKAFIDRLYCMYNFGEERPSAWSSKMQDQSRKAVIVAVCEQEDKRDMGFAMEAMRMPLEALGYQVVGELPVLKTFGKGRVVDNPEVMEEACRLGVLLAKETC